MRIVGNEVTRYGLTAKSTLDIVSSAIRNAAIGDLIIISLISRNPSGGFSFAGVTDNLGNTWVELGSNLASTGWLNNDGIVAKMYSCYVTQNMSAATISVGLYAATVSICHQVLCITPREGYKITPPPEWTSFSYWGNGSPAESFSLDENSVPPKGSYMLGFAAETSNSSDALLTTGFTNKIVADVAEGSYFNTSPIYWRFNDATPGPGKALFSNNLIRPYKDIGSILFNIPAKTDSARIYVGMFTWIEETPKQNINVVRSLKLDIPEILGPYDELTWVPQNQGGPFIMLEHTLPISDVRVKINNNEYISAAIDAQDQVTFSTSGAVDGDTVIVQAKTPGYEQWFTVGSVGLYNVTAAVDLSTLITHTYSAPNHSIAFNTTELSNIGCDFYSITIRGSRVSDTVMEDVYSFFDWNNVLTKPIILANSAAYLNYEIEITAWNGNPGSSGSVVGTMYNWFSTTNGWGE